MEDSTSFDLNDAIHNWQKCLRHSPNFREEDLTELESHVRDSVATLRAKGLAEDEAFLLATRRLGTASRLGPEFAKVNRTEVWLNRLLWMLVGAQVWGLLRGLTGVVENTAVVGGMWGLGFHVHSFQSELDWSRVVLPVITMSLAYLAVLAGLLGGGWRVIRLKDSEAGDFLAQALRRPVLLGVIAVLTLLVVSSLGTPGFSVSVLARHCSQPELGTLSLYQTVSGLLIAFAQTIAFVSVTIALLRRRFRLLAMPGYPS